MDQSELISNSEFQTLHPGLLAIDGINVASRFALLGVFTALA